MFGFNDRVILTVLIILITVLSARSESPLPDTVEVENLAGGFQFLEGPLWLEGDGLIFSDIPGNKIYKWNEETGISVYVDPSGNSNGLALDLNGMLIAAQTGHRRVARLEADGSWTPLADSYDGMKLNSPNDIAVHSGGSILFTDPPFNIPRGQTQELPFSGVFRIARSGELFLIDDELDLPNGICFSPDESRLYVNDSLERIIYVWDVHHDTLFTNKREFASISPWGYIDGMKVDVNGNLYCAGPVGVWIFSPDGDLLATVEVPNQTTNLNWGDEDRKSLYITSGDGIYRIRTMVSGHQLPVTGVDETGDALPTRFELEQNYPNPFNPATTIRYGLAEAADIQIKVYDLLGRKNSTLLSGYQEAGWHEIVFDASGLPSGIYLYQITAGEFIQARRMMLLK